MRATCTRVIASTASASAMGTDQRRTGATRTSRRIPNSRSTITLRPLNMAVKGIRKATWPTAT